MHTWPHYEFLEAFAAVPKYKAQQQTTYKLDSLRQPFSIFELNRKQDVSFVEMDEATEVFERDVSFKGYSSPNEALS